MDEARIPIGEGTRVLVLTGAGISAESGLATFRGGGGLWEGYPVEQVASPEGFAADPELVWRFYSMRRRAAAEAEPNAAHRALATLEEGLGDRLLLVTQNVDGLHARAGSRRVVEVHGTLWRTRCSRCLRPPFDDATEPLGPPLPRCTCGALLRPDIVWFGEMLDPAATGRVEGFLRAARRSGAPLVFVAVGTSGNVYPAAGYVHAARAHGAETWLVNLDPALNATSFDHIVTGPAGEVLPRLLGLDG
ncbi:MAG: NAD-dependent deacylase [Chloroflexi bacterium]|nr:NAD-dependent deacylase [Chloroflexota bacterium]